MACGACNTRVRFDVPSSVVLSLLLVTLRLVSIMAWPLSAVSSFAPLQIPSMVLPQCHSDGLAFVGHKQIERGSSGLRARRLLFLYEYCNQVNQMRNMCMHRQVTEQNRMDISGVLVTIGNFF